MADFWPDAEGGGPRLVEIVVKIGRCRGWRPPGCLILDTFDGPCLARCRGWRPPGLSTFSFFVLNAEGGGPPTRFDVDDLVFKLSSCGGPRWSGDFWLNAEGGGPLPVEFFTFLVVHVWLNAEGGGPLPVEIFTFLVVHFGLDAEGGGPRAVDIYPFLF